MFSPVKLALFAFISFAALALAIPSPAGHPQDPRALISNANVDIGKALDPLYYANSTNAAECVPPVIQEVVEIIAELISALRLSSLSACGCTAHEIIELLAVLLKTIFEPLDVVYGSYSGLGSLLGHLVVLVVELLNVVLALVGGLVGELLFLLIGNGCAGILLDLNLIAIIKLVGLGGLLGHL